MNDLISRQAAIDVVKGIDSNFVRYIEDLPSAQQQRWIPVSEKLPEKDGRYLVTCSKIGAWEVDWNIWHNEPKPSWLWEKGITAWMPLPDPYKEEEC